MAHSTYFDSSQVQEHLLTLGQARQTLATTEPLVQSNFVVGDSVRFRVNDAWSHGAELVDDDTPIDVTLS